MDLHRCIVGLNQSLFVASWLLERCVPDENLVLILSRILNVPSNVLYSSMEIFSRSLCLLHQIRISLKWQLCGISEDDIEG